MQVEEQRARAQQEFHRQFYQRFDHSRLQLLASWNDGRLDERHELLGEGGHFRAWRLRDAVGGAGAAQGGMDLVLKRAHAGFGKPDGSAVRDWLKCLPLLKALTAFVPPFECLLADDGAPCLVMPYGEAGLQAAAAPWLPVAAGLEQLRQELAAAGLSWRDVPQGRCWHGIPFIYDLSDIRPKQKPRSFFETPASSRAD